MIVASLRPDVVQKFPSRPSSAFTRKCQSAYRYIVESNPGLFPKKFQRFSVNDSMLYFCLDALREGDTRELGFGPDSFIYEELVEEAFDKTARQQYFTPSTIADFMVKMTGDRLKGRICDPAAGTGSLLVQACQQRSKHITHVSSFEMDERLIWVAGINLLLHKIKSFSCVWAHGPAGTLSMPVNSEAGEYDVVITNPPFASDICDPTTLNQFELGRQKLSRRCGVLFIEKCHSLLASGGTLGIIIDDSILNSAGASDVRQFIRNRFDILAVVSLPDVSFRPYATVNTSFLLMQKRTLKKKIKGRTFFAMSERVGRKGNGDYDIIYREGGTESLNSDLPQIIDDFRRAQDGEAEQLSKSSFLAPLSAERKCASGERLDYRYCHPSRVKSASVLKKRSQQLVRIGDICALRQASCLPSKDLSSGTLLYTGLADIESMTGKVTRALRMADSVKSSVRQYRPGDVIMSRLRPALCKVAAIPFFTAGYVSSECVVLVPQKTKTGGLVIDPELLSLWLRSSFVLGQILHLVTGIGRPRINSRNILDIRVPQLSERQQLESLRFVRAQEQKVIRKKEDAQAAIVRADAQLRLLSDRSLYGVQL